MAAEDSSRKYKAGADVIGALLETAVYSILYTRAVYPSILFEKRQVFAVPTPWPRAQPLIDYVKTAVDAVIKWLSQVSRTSLIYTNIYLTSSLVTKPFLNIMNVYFCLGFFFLNVKLRSKGNK